MLESIDVLIGLTVVLLALSMVVTVITQAVTAMLNSRGRHLLRGLSDLLQQLDPALTPEYGRQVAEQVLRHPLVSGATGPLGMFRARLGNVVHREEFTKLLMALACDDRTAAEDTARKALVKALENNGIDNPEAALKQARALALQLERSAPELSHTARQNLALMHAAESDFLAKINNWFDQTMDRTSQRFTASTRAITFFGAFIVAFGLQVDTPALVNRLAVDDELRAAFVEQAGVMLEDPAVQALVQGAQAPASGQPRNQTPDQPSQNASPAGSGNASPPTPTETARKYRDFLDTYGVITLPTREGYWEFRNVTLLGMLATAMLLTLGAPFWYNTLSQLLQLRSVLATKESANRKVRQSSDATAPAAASGATASPPPRFSGERGDTSAIG